MKTLFLCPVLFLTISLAHCEEKLFYLLGGGGEPKGKNTIFDNDLKSIGDFSKNSKWKTTVSFNGGHANTEDILSTRFKNAKNAGPFLEKNYNQIIDEMIAKINSGELKSGDQLMLVINTHGAKHTNKEKTHQVATAMSTANNLQNLAGAEVVNLDRLENLADLAAKNGVKLAIMDMSCFSGNLLNIKNDKTCLISATGSEQYGYAGTFDLGLFSFSATFSGKFFSSMEEGKNLEEIFLKAREKSWTADYPMISTSTGRSIDEMLYKFLSPYLDYNDNSVRNFGYSGEKGQFDKQVCEGAKNFGDLTNLLKQQEELSEINNKVMAQQFASLRKAVESYRDFQLEYEAKLNGVFDTSSEIKNILESKFGNQKQLWKDTNPIDFLTRDESHNILFYEKMVQGSNNPIWKKELDRYKTLQAMSNEVRNNLSQDAKERLKAYNDAFQKSDVTKDMAVKVATEAKKIYQSLYRKDNKSESNPCRDFKL